MTLFEVNHSLLFPSPERSSAPASLQVSLAARSVSNPLLLALSPTNHRGESTLLLSGPGPFPVKPCLVWPRKGPTPGGGGGETSLVRLTFPDYFGEGKRVIIGFAIFFYGKKEGEPDSNPPGLSRPREASSPEGGAGTLSRLSCSLSILAGIAQRQGGWAVVVVVAGLPGRHDYGGYGALRVPSPGQLLLPTSVRGGGNGWCLKSIGRWVGFIGYSTVNHVLAFPPFC